MDARYTNSTALHFQLEPVNAIGLQNDGKWELHTGAQWQSLSMPVYAKALGEPEENIVIAYASAWRRFWPQAQR